MQGSVDDISLEGRSNNGAGRSRGCLAFYSTGAHI
jgi:hypothetical protein